MSRRDREPCRYFSLCQEYISSLSWPRNYFNTSFNRCYCSRCYTSDQPKSLQLGTSTYVIPRDWARLGLRVDDAQARVENIWDACHNTYHGTNVQAALSILSHGQFLLRDDVLSSGEKIKGRTQYLFTSPTIVYSARYAYARTEKFTSQSGEHFDAKIVFQCKQKPGTYGVQGATGRARAERKLGEIIPKDQIAYFTEIRASVIPYGIMVHLTPLD